VNETCEHGVPIDTDCLACIDDAQRFLYHLDGWTKYWAYDHRPSWLRKKYP
jgi:hypothetical protein